MEAVLEQIEEHLKELIIPYLMQCLSEMFNCVNTTVGGIAADVGQTPSAFSPSVFSMIKTISETVIMPIAGIILTFVACYELVQLIISYNNLANFETWFIFKWVFKTAIAVELITHTWDFSMAVFDVAQHVVAGAGGVIGASTAIDASALAGMQSTIEAMDIMSILGLFIQIAIVNLFTQLSAEIINIIVIARMIEIYMYVSMAPIPFATFGNKEHGGIGIHYVKSLFALGFQGFLIMICVGIYAVLITSVAFTTDIVGSIWMALGYTLLLGFSLFKTSTVSKAILNAI